MLDTMISPASFVHRIPQQISGPFKLVNLFLDLNKTANSFSPFSTSGPLRVREFIILKGIDQAYPASALSPTSARLLHPDTLSTLEGQTPKNPPLACFHQEQLKPKFEEINNKCHECLDLLKDLSHYFEVVEDWLKTNESILVEYSLLTTTRIENITRTCIFTSTSLKILPSANFVHIISKRGKGLTIIQELYEEETAKESTAAATSSAPRNEQDYIVRSTFNRLQQQQVIERNQFSHKLTQTSIKPVSFCLFSSAIALMGISFKVRKPLIKITKSAFKIYKTFLLLIKQETVVYNIANHSFETADTQQFLERIQLCQNMDSVRAAFKSAGMEEEFLPERFEQFRFSMDGRRYQDQIKRLHHISQQKKSLSPLLSQPRLPNTPLSPSYANGEYSDRLLRQRSEDFDRRALLMEKHVDEQIRTISFSQDFEAIKRDFKTLLLIDFAQQEFPFTNLEDLHKAIADPLFVKNLARTRLLTIDKVAYSNDVRMRSLLMRKHQIAENHLHFTLIKESISILFNAILLFFELFGTDAKSSGFVKSLFESADKNLIKENFYASLLLLILPQLAIKIFSTLILGSLKYLFSRKCRPNEYSVDGYMVSLKMNLLKLKNYSQLALWASKRALLWLNIHLIEHRFMNMTISENDERTLLIDNTMEDYERECKSRQDELKGELRALKEKDLNEMPFSNSDEATTPLHSNGIAQIEGSNNLSHLLSTLKIEDFQFYPQEMLDSLNFHLGLGLSENGSLDHVISTQEKFSSHVKEFFTQKETDFLSKHANHQSLHPFHVPAIA